MLPIRIKACSESDLRMLGNLARNIQRVLPVTQADIDAAAALGKGWVVWKVIEVNDPIDNLRGGTQLVIKQNSITPGQNVRRVLIVSGPGGETVVIGPGPSPLLLPDAIAGSLQYVKAFGGTMQGVPDGYTLLNGVANGSGTYIDTGITPAVDDVEIELRVKPSGGSWYILQSRASGSPIWGISGSSTGSTILLGWAGTGTLLSSAITRNITHIYYVKATMKNGNATLYVKDETAGIEDTKTTTYTSSLPTLPFWLYGNQNNDRVAAGNTVYMARIKIGGVTVMDYVPALNPSNVVGFYDNATGNFKVSNEGTLTADQTIVPTPDAPMDIVSNNGVLKARHQSGLPLGYTALEYIETDGNSYIDTNLLLSNTSEFEITFQSADAILNTPVMGAISGGTSFTSTDNLCVTYTVASGLNAYSVYCNGAAGDANESWNAGDAKDRLKHTVKYNGLNIAPTLDGVDMEQLVPATLTTNTPTVTTWLFGRNNTGSGTKTQTGVRIYDFKVDGVAHFVPCKNASNVIGMYDTVSETFFTNAGTGDFTAGDPVSDPVEIYTDGPIETIAIKDDQNATVSTATCEDLLSVGTYTDEQEIISGVVTRKVGVKVLDGTETGWTKLSGVNYVSLPKTAISNMVSGTDATCLSNSFVQVPHGSISLSEECFSVGASYVNFKKAGDPTAAQFKQWLADQYAAGTPVIVIYPLATPTTNTVTPQPMQTAAGDNTLEITQASLTGLELEAEYVEA